MLRLRFHASWLPNEHNQFWTIIDSFINNCVLPPNAQINLILRDNDEI
ncbi:unnamed protein product, partial [Rotaria sp. Silwood1]